MGKTKKARTEQARFLGSFNGKPIHEMGKMGLLDVVEHLCRENDELRETVTQLRMKG